MNPVSRPAALPFALLIFALASSACNGSKSPIAPSPSTPAPAAASSLAGAVIRGAVVNGGPGVTVSVAGTGLAAPANAAGQFQLTGVAAGNVTLQVKTGATTAMANLGAVADHDQLQVTVTVNGSTATVDVDERVGADNEAEVVGKIASINASASTLQVGTTTVQVTASTVIRGDGQAVSFSNLVTGEQVEVKGMLQSGMVTAQSIEVRGASSPTTPPPTTPPTMPPSTGLSEVEGVVASIVSGTSCSAHTLAFVLDSGTMVSTSAATQFDEGSCAAVTVGAGVEAKGTLSGSSLAAQSVEVRPGPAPAPEVEDAEVKGAVASLVQGTSCSSKNLSFMLADKTTVTTSAATQFDKGSCSAIAVGAVVEAKGVRTGATIAASRVKLDDASDGSK